MDTVEVGRTLQLRAAPPAAVLRWSSRDTSKAHVDATGLVLARDTGEVTIVATVGRAQATVRLAVVPAVLAGAGDIGECGLDGARQTGALLARIRGTVFAAGDIAYPNGTAREFATCYDPFWGRLKARTRPVPGNHDYRVPGGAAYYDYFGAAAGVRGQGWYAYDLGDWRVYALNSMAPVHAGSAQLAWLERDLLIHPRRCVLAYWHHARFSSGPHHTSTRTAALFRALLDAGADVVVTGHDHLYERFAPLGPDGAPDGARGIREFVVGTGGGPLYAWGRIERGSEFRYNAGWGVLKLTLVPRGYGWEFLAGDDGRVVDSGTGVCH